VAQARHRIAQLLLLFVVSAQLPHHAIREGMANQSKPRDPPRGRHGTTYGFTMFLVPARRPQGEEG
jgi:hypothetical protein